MKPSYITRIEKAKEPHRFHIDVDEVFLLTVHEDVVVKLNLHKGMLVYPEQIEEMVTSEEKSKIKQAIFHYLSYQSRTVEEVRRYIWKKGFNKELGEQEITEMIHLGYLNDKKYALNWIEQKKQKGWGPLRLKLELVKKGIARQWIDEIFQNQDDDGDYQLLIERVEKRYRQIQFEPWEKVERKLGQYMCRLGYSSETVYSILSHFRSRHRDEERE